jgi:hypothetical protein
MTMAETHSTAEYEALLRTDFASFAQHCFHELNPRTSFVPNWHFETTAARLEAVRAGRIRRVIINMPPRHLKSHLGSVAFPAWCLGHDPSAQILCVSYAQDLADKLSRDCRHILPSDWYRQLFATPLGATPGGVRVRDHGAGCRLATSVGGVLTGRGADIIIIDERIAGWGLHPLESAALSRRTPLPDIRTRFLHPKALDGPLTAPIADRSRTTYVEFRHVHRRATHHGSDPEGIGGIAVIRSHRTFRRRHISFHKPSLWHALPDPFSP